MMRARKLKLFTISLVKSVDTLKHVYHLQKEKKGRGGSKRMMEEVNSTMIYFKNFCKCHNVLPAQQ
jgi:predicted adenine nucleotide alpha hydrolase (AANH) superfamily ATPase